MIKFLINDEADNPTSEEAFLINSLSSKSTLIKMSFSFIIFLNNLLYNIYTFITTTKFHKIDKLSNINKTLTIHLIPKDSEFSCYKLIKDSLKKSFNVQDFLIKIVNE